MFDLFLVTKQAAVPATGIRGAASLQETEIIDFKKENIDWRFKTRMRSNSNEFLESPVQFAQKRERQKAERESRYDNNSESVSILSSDYEEELLDKQEGQVTILCNAISNSFNLHFAYEASQKSIDEQKDREKSTAEA